MNIHDMPINPRDLRDELAQLRAQIADLQAQVHAMQLQLYYSRMPPGPALPIEVHCAHPRRDDAVDAAGYGLAASTIAAVNFTARTGEA